MDVYNLIREEDFQRLLESSKGPINMQIETVKHSDADGMIKSKSINSDQVNKQEVLRGEGALSQQDKTVQSTMPREKQNEQLNEIIESADDSPDIKNSWRSVWENLYFAK